MPVNTFRAWSLGLLWAIIIPGMNEFYYFRYPSLMVTGVRIFLSVPSVFPMCRSVLIHFAEWARTPPHFLEARAHR